MRAVRNLWVRNTDLPCLTRHIGPHCVEVLQIACCEELVVDQMDIASLEIALLQALNPFREYPLLMHLRH